jgi:hypothetical protein
LNSAVVETTADEGAPIPLSVPASSENFDEAAYLDANPDVRAAVESGVVASGRAYFEVFGLKEARLLRLTEVPWRTLVAAS